MDVVLAVDIGSTEVAVGLMTMSGSLVDMARTEIQPASNASGLFDQIAGLIAVQTTRAAEHHGVTPLVVGVSVAGLTTDNCEAVTPSDMLAWRDFPLRAQLMQLTRLPVFGERDARAMALAEGWLGAAQGHQISSP